MKLYIQEWTAAFNFKGQSMREIVIKCKIKHGWKYNSADNDWNVYGILNLYTSVSILIIFNSQFFNIRHCFYLYNANYM